MRVRALEAISYGVPQVEYKIGDEFETVEDMHATILEHAKKVMIVETATGDKQQGMPDKRRGRYNHRAMRAKE